MLIDCHTHALRSPSVTRAAGSTCPTGEQLVGRLDDLGIDKAVVLPMVSPECRNRYSPPEDIVEIVAKWPDRLIPFCNLDPRAGSNSPDTDFGRFLDVYMEMGCKGVGEVTGNLPFDHPKYWNMFRHIADRGLPMTIHIASNPDVGYGIYDEMNLPLLEKTLREFPGLNILGHSQAFWSEISGDVTEENRGGYPTGPVTEGGKAAELILENENVYGDLSAGSGFNAVSRDPEFGYWFLTEAQDKLLFGTDVCAPKNRNDVLINLKNFLDAAVEDGDISREVYDKVTGGNAVRLLGL
jgi:predicted TIM-barrel fold metal-dependent hydrolase